jgi:hypothetical protein
MSGAPRGREANREDSGDETGSTMTIVGSMRTQLLWHVSSTRLLELEDDAVCLAPDLGVEHQQAMIIGWIAQQVA